jgi:hypothetical protein
LQALGLAALSALPDEYSSTSSTVQLQLLLLPPAIDIGGNRALYIFTCADETPLVKAELFSLCFFPLATFCEYFYMK